MRPKCIIIKTQSKDFFNALIYKLTEIKNIRFWAFKFNGFYTITIKCINYYRKDIHADESKLYGSYIFLYSIVSIILSELFLTYYEDLVSKRIIISQKNKKIDFNKLSCISALLLDKNSPFKFSEILYTRRKCFLLDNILQSFRKRNYIYVDYFIYFFAKDYLFELNKIIIASTEILSNKPLYDYMMQFIFSNGDLH